MNVLHSDKKGIIKIIFFEIMNIIEIYQGKFIMNETILMDKNRKSWKNRKVNTTLFMS